MPSFLRHDGELLATSPEESRVLEGEWATSNTVLMRFPSRKEARARYDDPEYVALREIRQRTGQAKLVIVDRIAGQT